MTRIAWNKGLKRQFNTRRTHFKKGFTPWNKGKKAPQISAGKLGKKRPDVTNNIQANMKRSESMKKAHREWRHRNYKGGVSKPNAKIRHSFEYKLWRKSVFERDNYSCVWCGNRSSKGNPVTLNADHIKPFAYFPELRFAIDNGRTLCVPCHRTTFGRNT